MSRRRRRNKRNLPDAAVRLTIDRLSHEGRGIASNNGKIAFVDGSLPGETVTARYLNSRSRYDELTVETIVEPSPNRVTPACPFFGVCGGCSLQHLASSEQILFKQKQLLDQLCHATGLEVSSVEILKVLQADAYNYRRKARLAVRFVSKKGGALVGFREKHHTFITDMDDCHVLIEPIASLIKPLRELINQLDSKFDIPQFEVAAGERDAGLYQVALIMRHLKPLPESDLGLVRNFAIKHQVDFYLQSKGVETIRKFWPETKTQRLQYQLPDYGFTMEFHPSEFIQVNGAINRQIIPLALELLDLQKDDQVLDLFCGLGNFTLPIATSCLNVVGVEGSESMVERARENAINNDVKNAEFYATNLYESFSSQSWSKRRFTKVLLDPPRSGAIELIDFLANLGAAKIVYISCNPATLARDAARLSENGYTLKKAGVIDMFPHTAHVESIIEFVCTSQFNKSK